MKPNIYIISTIFTCLFLSAEVNAHCCWNKTNPGYFDLRVEIKNLGMDNCHLIKSDLQYGELYGSSFPLFLPSSGDAFYFTLSGPVTAATLVYECGKNKQISLSMKQYVKNNDKKTTIETSITDVEDIYEKHQVTTSVVGCCSSHEAFGLVSWELNN
jgi:hypothetical protein